LQDPADFVRIEIDTALRLGVPTIPVTVSYATMPSAGELPDCLRPLAIRNGQPVRPDPDFHIDMFRLICALETLGLEPADKGDGLDEPARGTTKTPADLLLHFANVLRDQKQMFINERDRKDRVADYLAHLSECLTNAATQFDQKGEAWSEMEEVWRALRSVKGILGPVLDDERLVEHLYQRLQSSYEADVFLTSLSTRTALPLEQLDEVDGDAAVAARARYELLSPAEREAAIAVELAKIKRAAGAFRGASAELRAST
jgi:hypothetical protein